MKNTVKSQERRNRASHTVYTPEAKKKKFKDSVQCMCMCTPHKMADCSYNDWPHAIDNDHMQW